MATEVQLEQTDQRTPEELAFESALDSMYDSARQAQGWAKFGTIGFDAYKNWVLTTNGIS